MQKAPLPGGEGGDQIFARNYGWYLFNCVPMCGNAEPNSKCAMVLFRDDVKMDKVQKRVTDYAARNGRHLENVQYHLIDDVILDCYGIPVPYVLTYREVQLSGELK